MWEETESLWVKNGTITALMLKKMKQKKKKKMFGWIKQVELHAIGLVKIRKQNKILMEPLCLHSTN